MQGTGTDHKRAFSEDAESTAGAQLTLSQLCPGTFENKHDVLDLPQAQQLQPIVGH